MLPVAIIHDLLALAHQTSRSVCEVSSHVALVASSRRVLMTFIIMMEARSAHVEEVSAMAAHRELLVLLRPREMWLMESVLS